MAKFDKKQFDTPKLQEAMFQKMDIILFIQT